METDAENGDATGLAYRNVGHIRNCLRELAPLGDKQSKTVDRLGQQNLIYRCIKTGFYVGDQEGLSYYRYPNPEELEREYYQWWRCANDSELSHTS